MTDTNVVYDENNNDELECHFKWKPEKDRNKIRIEELEKKLLRDVAENPTARVQTYSLLGYILTLDPDTCDPEKSKEYFEKALEDAGDDEDKRFVPEANLIMNGMESGIAHNLEEEKKTLQKKWMEWKRGDPQKLAFTYGCHGYALSKFGPNSIEKAVIQYDRAMEYDPEHWNWSFGKALMLERNRSLNTPEIKPSAEILELFEKAAILSQSNEYVLAFYANCLTSLYHKTYIRPKQNKEASAESQGIIEKYCSEESTRNKQGTQNITHDESNRNAFADRYCLEQKIERLLKEAIEKAKETNSITVFKRCCRSYRDMRWFPQLLECCEKILNIPFYDDTGILHQVAQCFMIPQIKDFNTARELLEKCIESAPHGNLFAAFDLLKVRIFLGEAVNIDVEYQKLLARYKPVKTDIAFIHENWAKSLQILDGSRVEDIMYHCKEAIRHFDPTVVERKYSWSQLKSICTSVIQAEKYNSQVTSQQACKTLGWMHFIPEPKTKDNLRIAYIHLSLYRENYVEQADIELYGNVLCALKKYEDALKQYEKLKENHDKKSLYRAVCFFHLGKQKSENPEWCDDEKKDTLFLKSVQNGCLDGCEELLSILDKRNKHLQYHYCGYIKMCVEYTRNFALKGPVESKSHCISRKIEHILGLVDEPLLEGHQELMFSFIDIRKIVLNICMIRAKMDKILPPRQVNTLSALLVENGKDTLTKSRSILDHLHNNLQRQLNSKSTDKVYFPLITDKQRPKNLYPGSQEAKDWALKSITKKFENDFGDKDGSKSVANKCKELIQFIAPRQPCSDPERYIWLYDAWDVVNVIKHRTNITEIEWTNPENNHKVNLVELAQRLAFYAEGMMQEYCKLY